MSCFKASHMCLKVTFTRFAWFLPKYSIYYLDAKHHQYANNNTNSHHIDLQDPKMFAPMTTISWRSHSQTKLDKVDKKYAQWSQGTTSIKPRRHGIHKQHILYKPYKIWPRFHENHFQNQYLIQSKSTYPSISISTKGSYSLTPYVQLMQQIGRPNVIVNSF